MKDNIFNLNNMVAVVTGGAGNLGPSFGEALAGAGARVVLADMREKSAEAQKAAKNIASATGRACSFIPVDVAEESSVKALFGETLKQFGRVDVLVNGAIGVGRNHFAGVQAYSAEDFNKVLSVTVTGTFLCSRNAVAIMQKQGGGSIVNIASIYGVVGADQRIYGKSGINSPASYAASKGAIVNLTRYLAVYWAKQNIRVNCISPGGVFNEQDKGFVEQYAARTPMGRMAEKRDLQGALVYLASPAAAYVTGQNLIVDGGWTAW